jgi:hypothetical protein
MATMIIFVAIVVIAFFVLVAPLTKSMLRFGTISTVAGGLLALICLIIFVQPKADVWVLVLIPPFFLGCFVLLGGLAVVVLHYVVRWVNS